jgi:Tir chaperone protein (CesT) family
LLIDNYARQLGHDLKLEEALAPDEQGGYRLTLTPGIEVSIDPLEQGFVFRARVGEAKTEEELLSSLMLANLMGQGTGGAVLSLDETGTQVILTRELPLQLTYVEFRDGLEEFFNYAEFWKKRVKEANTNAGN